MAKQILVLAATLDLGINKKIQDFIVMNLILNVIKFGQNKKVLTFYLKNYTLSFEKRKILKDSCFETCNI